MKKIDKNIQLDFYKDNKVNPVIIKTSGEQWQSHIWQRNNLYENHLKVPSTWFNGKSVIEFGPNGGENAIVNAINGSKVTLAEPHLLMHETIKNLFSAFNLSSKLINIYSDTVEDFKEKSKYDLVIAEGFIHALSDRKIVVNKLCSHSNDKVVFTYSDKYGYFFEAFKRFIYRKVLNIENVNSKDFNTQLLYAKRLFLTEFSLLKTSRSFESWVVDVLLNPCQTSETLDTLPDLIKEIGANGFNYLSGSPSFDSRDKDSWYKKTSNETIFDEYLKNTSFFINGNNNTRFSASDLNLICQYTSFFLDYSSNKAEFNYLENLEDISFISNWCHSIDISLIIESACKGNAESIIKQYCKSKVSKVWGMGHHYVCLSKSNPHNGYANIHV